MYSYKNKKYNKRGFILNRKLTIRKRAASDIAFIFTSRSIGTTKVNITFIRNDCFIYSHLSKYASALEYASLRRPRNFLYIAPTSVIPSVPNSYQIRIKLLQTI